MDNNFDKVLLSPMEFSKVSGIGICRVRNLCSIAGFPSSRNGKRYLIHSEKAIAWIMENENVTSKSRKRIRD